MEQALANRFIEQALATAMNYHMTGRSNKALEVVSQAGKAMPGDSMVDSVWSYIVLGGPMPKYLRAFMGEWWQGESIYGKTIEVFCDQGMGDTINCLRYLKYIKDEFGPHIVLNCYAFFNEFAELMQHVPYVDEFTQLHRRCDYYTNILSLPTMIHGVKRDVYYPAHWQDVLDKDIPPMPVIYKTDGQVGDTFRVGLAHKSNAQNPELARKKSVPIGQFARFEDGINELWSIIPDTEKYNFMVQPPLNNLLETAKLISEMEVVVSVDTVTLHLAGAMGKKTLGILPFNADARWGLGKETVWYPSVELYRQVEEGDWEKPITEVKDRLVSLRDIS
jgi:hypothetical protein